MDCAEIADHQAIRVRLDAISILAHTRRLECDGLFAATFGGANMDFMTPEELQEFHHLQQQLPSFAEEREAAAERIRNRIASRKLIRQLRQFGTAWPRKRALRKVQEIDDEIYRVKRNANIKIVALWLAVFAIWCGLYVASQA
jgi:hypothetical protein